MALTAQQTNIILQAFRREMNDTNRDGDTQLIYMFQLLLKPRANQIREIRRWLTNTKTITQNQKDVLPQQLQEADTNLQVQLDQLDNALVANDLKEQ